MGKKRGSWFSAIKRAFTHSSKDKPTDLVSSDKRSSKDKKKGKGVLRHGETKSFIPLFRAPSSIEQILGEADHLLVRPSHSFPEQPKTPQSLLGRPTSPKPASPKAAASPRAISSPGVAPPSVVSPPKVAPPTTLIPEASSSKAPPPPRAISSPRVAPPRAISSPKVAPPSTTLIPKASSSKAAPPKVTQSRNEISYVARVEPTLSNQHISATKIQAAYRGYLGRRNFRALRGLVRLQEVVRGQNVNRQTVNAMKQMQLLVRVQTQIQSRRIQTLENQATQRQTLKEVENTLSKWTQLSEGGDNEDWDASVLTKEEEEARLQKKVEAVIKRERAMAYAYSHQPWKSNPKSAHSPSDIRFNGFPWWWNWLERQLPPTSTTSQTPKITSTPPRPNSGYKASPQLQATNYESLTPRSSKSTISLRNKQFHTPTKSPMYSKPRTSAANSAYDVPLNDTDSLTSCPPFSAPNYMTPTVSAKAKARPYSNPKERVVVPGTPGNDSNRRFSFPISPIGSVKWSKGTDREAGSQRGVIDKPESTRSIGDFSVDSAVSMPATFGRKPFNRFV